MTHNPQDAALSCYVAPDNWEQDVRRDRASRYEASDSMSLYEMYMLRKPIPLSPVEYRIIEFLASKPYWAFNRREIAEGVNKTDHPVTEQSVDGHIATLRNKLGPWADFVQTVPYIGYRFKK